MADVLVVDGESDVRTILAFCLAEAGLEVREASSAEEALEVLAADPPRCLVVDPSAGGADAYGLLRRRRDRALAHDTRVLILTARSSERDFLRGFQLGADAYLTKPFEPDEVVRRVQDLLRAPTSELASRREEERARAALLERLELAFARPRVARA